jgi:hypothetical protein
MTNASMNRKVAIQSGIDEKIKKQETLANQQLYQSV